MSIFKSFSNLVENVTDIATAPVKIVTNAAIIMTEPIKSMANEVVEASEEMVEDIKSLSDDASR